VGSSIHIFVNSTTPLPLSTGSKQVIEFTPVDPKIIREVGPGVLRNTHTSEEDYRIGFWDDEYVSYTDEELSSAKF